MAYSFSLFLLFRVMFAGHGAKNIMFYVNCKKNGLFSEEKKMMKRKKFHKNIFFFITNL